MKLVTKILALTLAMIMMVGFAACGSKTIPDEPADKPAKTYVIYSDNAFAPFEFLDTATNQYVGVDMELLAAIAEDQGFAYEMKNEGFDAAMGAVQAGQADAMIAGMTIKPERQEIFDFSEGYFEDGSILVVGKDSPISSVEDLKGKVVAAKKGTTSTDYAESIKDQYGFTIQYFEDSPTMYQTVVNGNADACFEDFSVIGWAIKNDGIALKTVGDVVNPGYYGFAVKKGSNPELITMFNAGLANLKANGKYEEILAKYGY
ncbi:MAG: transporter substrate-binding domain-containing protein [Clostridia bacterium]|nr:transporter substrate-binding domain-containing protein [Clostridia bacterium]